MDLALRVERASSVRKEQGASAKFAAAPVVSRTRVEPGFTTKCQYQNINPRNDNAVPRRAGVLLEGAGQQFGAHPLMDSGVPYDPDTR
jgi:hypothetical protein